MRIPILLFALLLSASAAFAQGPIPPDGQVQADRAERDFEKSIPPPIHHQSSLDFTKVKGDADELVALSQSIHSGVDNVGKGMLPKRLRNELTP
jgi:hypothetical protein